MEIQILAKNSSKLFLQLVISVLESVYPLFPGPDFESLGMFAPVQAHASAQKRVKVLNDS